METINMSRKRRELMFSESGFEVLWANQEYIEYAEALLRQTVLTLETCGRLMTINDANLFSEQHGHPANVSYPPVEIAKRIAIDGKKYLDGTAMFSRHGLMRQYKFDLQPVESVTVVTRDETQRIPTAKVLMNIGWS